MASVEDVHIIRYGYNLADLDILARAAVRRGARSGVVPMHELADAAWAAIAEHLLTAAERPDPHTLIGAGMRAISEAINAGERVYGWDRQQRATRPGFATFWQQASGPTPSPEARVVERAALWQIWPQLTEIQREALLALASCQDYRAAAASLGVSYGTFHMRVRLARQAFLALWHQGETPSWVWSADRRRWRDGRRVRHRPLYRRGSFRQARARAREVAP